MIVKPFPNINCTKITVTSTATNLFDLIRTAGSLTDDLFGSREAIVDALDITIGAADVVAGWGLTPTATEGDPLESNSIYRFRGRDIKNLKLIRTGGSDVTCYVTYGYSEEGESESVSQAGGGSLSGGATEAKQDSQITQETAINTVLGAKDDTVASSDTGTFSLVALVKRGLQTLTSLYGLVTQKTNAAISGSTSSITAVAAVPGQTTEVYRLEIVADAATNITIKAGATSLTGAIPVSANGSISITSNYGEPVWTGGTNEAITIDQSGSANIRGYISYVTSA